MAQSSRIVPRRRLGWAAIHNKLRELSTCDHGTSRASPVDITSCLVITTLMQRLGGRRPSGSALRDSLLEDQVKGALEWEPPGELITRLDLIGAESAVEHLDLIDVAVESETRAPRIVTDDEIVSRRHAVLDWGRVGSPGAHLPTVDIEAHGAAVECS